MTAGLLCGCNRNEQEPRAAENGRKYQERMAAFRQEKEARAALPRLQTGIQKFQHELGRLPNDLLEVARLGYVDEIPEPPPGYKYYYDKERGNIRFIPIK